MIDVKEEKYSSKYLKYLDETYEYVPLYYYVVFKSIMFNNINIFKKFLINVLKLDTDISSIVFLDKELFIDKITEHNKVIDINVLINNSIILDIEVNTSRYSVVKDRNDLYLDKLNVLSFQVGEKYKILNNKDIWQLNLNANPKEKRNILECDIVDYDKINKHIYLNRNKILVKNLVNYKRLYYNGGRNMSFDEIFMAGLMSNSYTELYSIMSKIIVGEELEEFMDSIVATTAKIPFSLHSWNKKKFDKMIMENIKKEREKEILEKGISRGYKEKTTLLIKSMLQNKLSYEMISKVTNKSVEEIKKIEKEMN